METFDDTGAKTTALHLASLRDKAKLTQAELAKRITVSAARVSRIEAGDIPLTREEVNTYLNAIGTDAAEMYSQYLDQDWKAVTRPSFEHPSREALWTINELLKKIRSLKADPELKSVFVRHIEAYENELNLLAADLHSTEHNLAFVGSIGVGKSTAICTLTDLRANVEGPLNKQMVLEAGAGGTTICEVHVRTGPQHGLIVEPRSEEAIKYDVCDFAEYLLRVTRAKETIKEGENEDGPGITKEINRAIRNMSGLGETKTKDSSGKVVRHDPAKELATKIPDSKELVVQVLSQMSLPRRDQRDIWYNPGNKLDTLEWLQQTFMEINNGRHAHFSLPARIEVVLPRPVLADEELNIRILDTKGIDGAATRADLDRLFDDSRTHVVLCSSFNNAPDPALQQLLQRVSAAGAQNIAKDTSILVLPRPEEAAAVKDGGGNLVENDHEGYELKGIDVEMHLTRLGLQAIPVKSFNARNDDLEPMRDFLVQRVKNIRAVWEQRVRSLTKTVDDLILNHKQEQTAVVFEEVAVRIDTWVKRNREINTGRDQSQNELVHAIGLAHHRSVWASVRRKGDWYNLDYYYQMGYGARMIAAKHIQKKIGEFNIITQNLIDDPELSPAHDMLEQVVRLMRSNADEMQKKIEIVGRAVFEDELRDDTEFWEGLGDVGGRGYRDYIALKSNGWFERPDLTAKHEYVMQKIAEGWIDILSSLKSLLHEVPAV